MIRQGITDAAIDMPSFVLFRLPNQNTIELICANKTINIAAPINPDNLGEGFVYANFDQDYAPNNLLLPAEYRRSFDLDKLALEANDHIMIDSTVIHYHKGNNSEINTTDKNDFCAQTSMAIEHIKLNHFQKVVLSKCITENIDESTDPITIFLALERKYPNAFIHLFSSPESGTWIGATPELLFSVNKNKTYQTVSLAGTQLFINNDLKEVVWKQKEIEEQALVSRYIINCFKKIRLREYEEDGPKTIKAGNLVHLKTTFSVQLDEVEHRNVADNMLTLLHPTSAVCGMPRQEATAFIKAHEKHNRSYYTGFMGLNKIDGETNYFVNLRTARIFPGKQITYFAGAGITEDSDPENEWVETEMKCLTLKRVINEL